MKEQSFIRIHIGKTASGKEIRLCVEDSRIDEWIETQFKDFHGEDLLDLFCACEFVSTQDYSCDFDLKELSRKHINFLRETRKDDFKKLIINSDLESQENRSKRGSVLVSIKPVQF